MHDFRALIAATQAAGAVVVMAADLLALTLLTPPGELGADVAVGNTQRFGVPMGFGGPHAAYMATRQDYARSMPGRLIGVSEDAQGHRALRMALQTREQHIRREKATSNICTAQVLLAIMSGMYAVYHGPKGLTAIARRTHALTQLLANGLTKLGHTLRHAHYFDTLAIELPAARADAVFAAAEAKGMNLRRLAPGALGISLDETTRPSEVEALLAVFAAEASAATPALSQLEQGLGLKAPASLHRTSAFLTHQVFNSHHSETEMLRYLRRLEARDLSLAHSMIPLGSCTMKLNATSEMFPVTWPQFGRLHPFVPANQAEGYRILFKQLEGMLSEITGFAACSLQPNAGSQGEYAGLLAIRGYHASRGEAHRDVCLIPSSAHGTNPAVGGDGRLPRGGGALRRAGQHRRGRSEGPGRGARGQARRADGHLSLDPRRVRGVDQGDLRDRARARRTGLHGRREPERPGGADPAGRDRRGRLPHQPAQDLLHPARRRRTGHGPHLRGRAPAALPAPASDDEHRWRAGAGGRLRGAPGAAPASWSSPGCTSP